MKKKTHFGLLCLAFLLATHSYKITPSGIFYKTSEVCTDGSVRLSLEPDEVVSVFPSTGCRKSGF